MKWTGHLTRALTGELHHSDDVLRFTASRADDGSLTLQGDTPNAHWTGAISQDRTAWHMECERGFLLRGTVTFEGGRYSLVQTGYRPPADLALPGEPGGPESLRMAG